MLRKFFYAPSVVQQNFAGNLGDWIYLGSGDREDPQSNDVVNRFYAIKNPWPTGWENDDDTLAVTDLSDVNYDIYNDTGATQLQKDTKTLELELKSGWWFNLGNSGEKIVSSPLVFDKVVYFTTFTPTSESSPATDSCSTGSGAGIARLYAVNYENGSAVFDLDNDGQKERSYIIGSGIPSQPIVVATEDELILMIASEKKVVTSEIEVNRDFIPYYWLQIQE